MNKKVSVILGAIIIIALVGVGIAHFHKSSKPTASTATSTATTKSNTASVNNAVLTTKTDATLGKYLADPSGKALYTFASDTSGVSNCTDTCLASWPAYQDTGATTNLPQGVSTIKRTDNGQTQYTYNGMPLYFFAGDSAGHVTGNGVNSFSIATPAAASTSTTTTTPSTGASAPASSSTSSGYPY